MAPQPTYPFVWFASGEWCQQISRKEVTSDQGVECYEFILNPSTNARRRHNLRPGKELDEKTNYLTKEYPKAKVEILDDTPTSGRILVLTDFNGKDTNFSRREAHLTETIISLQKYIKVLKARMAFMVQELKKATSYQEEQMSSFNRITKLYKEAVGRTTMDLLTQEPTNDMHEQQQ